MILHIAIELEAGDQSSALEDWDVPDVVAKAVQAKLGGSLRLVDTVRGSTPSSIEVEVLEVCGLYDNPTQRPAG
jgi:hypothetical protein